MEIRESIDVELGGSNIKALPFIANLTHELRTPMIGILGYVDLLEHSELNTAQQDSLGSLRECAEQLLCTIDSILEAAQLHNGTMAVNLSQANIGAVLNKAINSYNYDLQNKGLLLEVDIAKDLDVPALIDPVKIDQIMRNLISNAVKFTSRGGIKITARLTARASGDDWLEVTISDTGTGISTDLQGKVFDYFVQSDNTPSRPYGGAGVGLFICKEIVQLMKGEIWVKSQTGMGSTFGYTIPVRLSPPVSSDLDRSDIDTLPDNDDLAGFSTARILLVEDNLLNQKLMAQMLSNYGFEVTLAANGVECLSRLQHSEYDVVLMDMQMPVMNGFEATRLIRANPDLDGLPIIAVTANSTRVDREECLACGCDSFLAKPFRSETLVQEIKTHLAHRFIKDNRDDDSAKRLVSELLPEFIEMLDETLTELQRAVDAKDWPGIKNISHDLKGTAGMYGFMQISELATQIQNAAGNMNYKLIRHLFKLTLKCSQNLSQNVKSQAMV